MSVSERQTDGVTLVTVTGPLTQGEAGDALRDKVSELLRNGQRQIVVNLGAVYYMDSSGLGMLVSAYATTTRQGGALKLVGLTRRLQDLLVIAKLLNVFECFNDEPEALRSFGLTDV